MLPDQDDIIHLERLFDCAAENNAAAECAIVDFLHWKLLKFDRKDLEKYGTGRKNANIKSIDECRRIGNLEFEKESVRRVFSIDKVDSGNLPRSAIMRNLGIDNSFFSDSEKEGEMLFQHTTLGLISKMENNVLRPRRNFSFLAHRVISISVAASRRTKTSDGDVVKRWITKIAPDSSINLCLSLLAEATEFVPQHLRDRMNRYSTDVDDSWIFAIRGGTFWGNDEIPTIEHAGSVDEHGWGLLNYAIAAANVFSTETLLKAGAMPHPFPDGTECHELSRMRGWTEDITNRLEKARLLMKHSLSDSARKPSRSV